MNSNILKPHCHNTQGVKDSSSSYITTHDSSSTQTTVVEVNDRTKSRSKENQNWTNGLVTLNELDTSDEDDDNDDDDTSTVSSGISNSTTHNSIEFPQGDFYQRYMFYFSQVLRMVSV